MPKATVDKNAKSLFSENKVRFAKKRLMPAPTSNMVLTKNVDERHFRAFVAMSPDKGHDVRAAY